MMALAFRASGVVRYEGVTSPSRVSVSNARCSGCTVVRRGRGRRRGLGEVGGQGHVVELAPVEAGVEARSGPDRGFRQPEHDTGLAVTSW